MKIFLKQLAQFQIGYQPRGRIEPDPQGVCQIIQIKDLDDQGSLRTESLYRVTPEVSNYARYNVNQGDVLFLSRGNRNLATPVDVSLVNTIAAGYFFILKLNSAIVLPEYLAWYINSTPAQQYIQNVARRGSHMLVVPKSALEDLEVDVPTLRTQQTIVALDKLSKKERSLLRKLEGRRNELIRALCLQSAKQKTTQG
jgi:restriction endonuclease S subunit